MTTEYTATRTCIREVLEGTIAGVRAITAGALSCDIAEGASDETILGRLVAHQSASWAAIAVAAGTDGSSGLASVKVAFPKSESRTMGPSNVRITGLEVTLTLFYLLPTSVLGNAGYDAVKSTAELIAATITDAFEWPGKLTTTSAAVATGIVSGVLSPQPPGWQVVRDTPPRPGDTTGGLFAVSCTYAGHLLTSASTS